MGDLLTVSAQGGIVILAVAALRLMLKKVPKRLVCLLWLLAGTRLLLPFQIESSLSLQPNYNRGSVWEGVQAIVAPEDHSGHGWGEILDAQGNVLVSESLEPIPGRGVILDSQGNVLVGKPLGTGSQIPDAEKTETNWKNYLPYIWLLGLVAMGAYSSTAYLRLKKRVRDSVILEEGVWVTGNIDTAFVLGFFRPQIYLPVWLAEEHREFVLAHERSHIARRDHWWKVLGFATLSIHWFNPLVWLGYVLLCRDLEMACDENVVKTMDLSRRKAYSAALVSCSAVHPTIAACPVAFGEISVKERVKNVLNFKKPGFWISVVAILAAIFVAVFLLTSPAQQPMEEKLLENLYHELESMQAQEDLYMNVSIRNEGEYDYFRGQEQEFWKSGNDWYRVIAMETKEGTYWEHYLQIGDTQFVSRESEQIPRLESLDWTVMPEEYAKDSYVLLTRDWTDCEVLEVKKENSEDGGVYTVLIQGDLTGDSKTTYYEHTHAFHLDENFRLVGIVEYSKADKYMEGFDGTAGRFDTQVWTQVTFRAANPEETRAKLYEISREAAIERELDIILGTATVEKEEKEFDVSLGTVTVIEFDEAEKQMIDQCREAVEEFQSRDSVCVMVENQFGGDILNDSSDVEYYQNGDNWLIRKVIENSDFRQVWFGAQVDGLYRERESYDLANPANGEDWDTGWVEDLDGEPGLPWLCAAKWEDLLITDVKTEDQENLTWVHLTVLGSPYEMAQEVKEYKLTFVFQGDVFRKVILEYDMQWNGGRGHVASTIRPETMLPEEINSYIRQVADYMKE